MTEINQLETLENLQSAGIASIAKVSDLVTLDEIRVKLTGKNGQLTEMMKAMGSLAPEDKKSFGQALNVAKSAIFKALASKKEQLEDAVLNEKLASEAVDITLPVGESAYTGKMHPISYVIEEVEAIFEKMGFVSVTGKEIENDFYNFTALNIPDDHPARQDHDTFYLNQLDSDGKRRLLRTQTSNVQIHTMENFKPPFSIISVGRVYRNDSDLTHTPQFHQVEGMLIDKIGEGSGATFGHLKGTLQKFLEDYFEREITMRLRPSYFPFTEPSAEVDIECVFCKGDGCRVCSQTGWLEVLGCGMTNSNVLKHGGIDHEKFQGFAFGVGIERLTMLKYGVTDLRMFFESQAAFLRHFGKPASGSKV